ncbi:unnamed protein product [Moneuplotes crassus]|uniref:Uncharacterized protein n=1 Tax=Euplotes crassus TaxID=5936 RepID=A0AAD1UBA1_EUPCR|nr:unnamed protein product [Moneuplotes crassus]
MKAIKKSSASIVTGNKVQTRTYRLRQTTARDNKLNFVGLKYLSPSFKKQKDPTKTSKKSSRLKVFKFDPSIIRSRKPSARGKRAIFSKKANQISTKRIIEDYDREDIFLPYNETFQLRDYLEYEGEEANQATINEEKCLKPQSHWTKIYTSIMEKPYFLKRLKGVRLQNQSRSRRRDKIEEKFQDILSKTIQLKAGNKRRSQPRDNEHGINITCNTFKVSEHKSSTNSLSKAIKRRKKSSIGIKPSTLERIASPKKGLHNFGNKRRSMEVDCTNKLKIAPSKGLKLDNIFTYSRKPKNTPMAKLINLSCENPSLERIKTMKKTCIKLQKWVKSHAKSRSQDFHRSCES